jgi:hypothetical protein
MTFSTGVPRELPGGVTISKAWGATSIALLGAKGFNIGRKKNRSELAEYRNFLGEVDADAISRVNSSDHAPRDFNQQDALLRQSELPFRRGGVTKLPSSITDSDLRRAQGSICPEVQRRVDSEL